jgi:hypothetical protein
MAAFCRPTATLFLETMIAEYDHLRGLIAQNVRRRRSPLLRRLPLQNLDAGSEYLLGALAAGRSFMMAELMKTESFGKF